jgi:hypothetical protein
MVVVDEEESLFIADLRAPIYTRRERTLMWASSVYAEISARLALSGGRHLIFNGHRKTANGEVKKNLIEHLQLQTTHLPGE